MYPYLQLQSIDCGVLINYSVSSSSLVEVFLIGYIHRTQAICLIIQFNYSCETKLSFFKPLEQLI